MIEPKLCNCLTLSYPPFSCAYQTVSLSEEEGHSHVLGWYLCVWKNNCCTNGPIEAYNKFLLILLVLCYFDLSVLKTNKKNNVLIYTNGPQKHLLFAIIIIIENGLTKDPTVEKWDDFENGNFARGLTRHNSQFCGDFQTAKIIVKSILIIALSPYLVSFLNYCLFWSCFLYGANLQ